MGALTGHGYTSNTVNRSVTMLFELTLTELTVTLIYLLFSSCQIKSASHERFLFIIGGYNNFPS